MGATQKFTNVLKDAARAAWKDGAISRLDLARINLAIIFRPQAIAECQSALLDEATARGTITANAAGDVSAIDWAALFALFIELMPLILQIIALI